MKFLIGLVMAQLIAAPQAATASCAPSLNTPLVKDRHVTAEFAQILDEHLVWLRSNEHRLTETWWGQAEDSLRAQLCGADLRGLDLRAGANPDRWSWSLAGSLLVGANLEGADLFLIDLRAARLDSATLRNVRLNGANLERADLSSADLRNARMVGTRVRGAAFGGADLAGAVFEPDPDGVTAIVGFRNANGIEHLRYESFPDALYALRRAMRDAGRDDIGKRLTRAIERSRTAKAWRDGEHVRAAARFLFWGIATNYGLSPGRALIILLMLIPLFGGVYFAAAWRSPPTLYRVVPPSPGEPAAPSVTIPVDGTGRQAVLVALRFSITSAFAVGYGKVDVGSWILRIQGTDETLRAYGWPRTVSGVQSLLSVMLLAAWLLTSFGSPFG